MEVSVNSDFLNTESNEISLQTHSLNELEDGELIEDANSIVTEEEKKILRAKRFGPVDNVPATSIQDPKLQRLHKRMKVNSDTRLEALHLHGTDRMKTEDVFALFLDYIPASIEWLSDKTCNVFWLDQESCAKALENCTVKIKGQTSEESDDSEEEFINKEDIRCAIPPGGIWRRSQPTQLAPNLLIRFATYNDKRSSKPNNFNYNDSFRKNFVFLDEGDEGTKKFRPDTGNPWVDIAREWSYYEMKSAAKKQEGHQVRDARELINKGGRLPIDIAGSVGSKKRIPHDYSEDVYFNNVEDEEQETDVTDRIVLGKEMQADIEEKKILNKKLRLKNRSSAPRIDLRQRLSNKGTKLLYDDSNSEEKFREQIINRKHERTRRKRHLEDSWTRVDSDDGDSEEEDVQSDSKEDLRRKLRKQPESSTVKKKSSTVLTQDTKKFIPDTSLQIEIDNDIYFERINRDDD